MQNGGELRIPSRIANSWSNFALERRAPGQYRPNKVRRMAYFAAGGKRSTKWTRTSLFMVQISTGRKDWFTERFFNFSARATAANLQEGAKVSALYIGGKIFASKGVTRRLQKMRLCWLLKNKNTTPTYSN